MKTYIYGKHVIEEALKNKPESVERIFFIKPDSNIKKLAKNIQTEILNPKATLPKGIDLDVKHQGVFALIDLNKLLLKYRDYIENTEVNKDTCFVILGELQDPQNVGAIIRSAVALGISAIILPEHNQVKITGSVVKVSTGMVFSIPIIKVMNINNTIRDLKDRGFWVYGLDGESDNLLNDQKFDEPTVFVLGNEAKGIREKTKEVCDVLIKIPMNSKCESMNVASSSSVVLYEWSRQHPKRLI
ncbi:MAG: 23S rRNA (guanosine(2251)-2'-O)-methyltransferase RlmB [Patescibacteria group bacterium]|nr:23S rRNA (guanosine(2251)-2'-O)-methyltransferase RlmB [Patescibacteria group bacterium]